MSCILYQIQYGQREPRKSQKIRLIKKMAGVEFKVTGDEESKTVILSCLGSGYRNYSKASTQLEMVSGAFECDTYRQLAATQHLPLATYIVVPKEGRHLHSCLLLSPRNNDWQAERKYCSPDCIAFGLAFHSACFGFITTCIHVSLATCMTIFYIDFCKIDIIRQREVKKVESAKPTANNCSQRGSGPPLKPLNCSQYRNHILDSSDELRIRHYQSSIYRSQNDSLPPRDPSCLSSRAQNKKCSRDLLCRERPRAMACTNGVVDKSICQIYGKLIGTLCLHYGNALATQ